MSPEPEADRPADGWRRCSTCKRWIAFEAPHVTCSVSTCNQKRTGLVFCSEPCWDAHLPTMRHRDPWAVESRAPSRAAWEAETEAEPASATAPARRRVVRPAAASTAPDETPREILIVASRLKAYVQARSGMNTSDSVMPLLSDIVRRVCDEAIGNARRDGRKTVLDRDVPR